MEKKRSSRSCKSPGTSIFPKSPLLYESYKSGCGWKLINFFDFRHVKSSKNSRLSSDKKFIRDSAGNVYTRSQLDLLNKLHEKCQCNDASSKIVEEKMSCKPKTRTRSLSSEREDDNYESKPREIKRIKNPLEEIEKTNDKHKQMDEKNLQVQVGVNETLISSKAEDKKQFMEALDILSSNKELFITLLQDPNSFLANKDQDFKRSQVNKSLSMADEIVLLKPRLSSSSVDDKVNFRFKHVAKKLKLVVGSNKDIIIPESSSRADVSTSTVGHRSPESPVFRRKKRVESDVFKLSIENDVMPRRQVVEREQERSDSSPVYEVPNALNSLQTKLKERRQKLEKRRESFKLWSLDNNFEVFDLKPHNSYLNSTGSADYTSLRTHEEDRYIESSLGSLERREINVDQPSPVSVLERIQLEDETVSPTNVKILKIEEHNGLSVDDQNFDFVDNGSVYAFVKKVLVASRLNWTNLMARCSEETSLLDEFSHGSHKNNQLLLVLDYTDEILRDVYNQDIKYWPFTPSKSSRVVNLSASLIEDDLIHKTMKRFDWSCDSRPRTLDQIIDSDLTKPCLWLEVGGESEGVVSDVVEKIMLQLVFEISHELRTMHRRI